MFLADQNECSTDPPVTDGMPCWPRCDQKQEHRPARFYASAGNLKEIISEMMNPTWSLLWITRSDK